MDLGLENKVAIITGGASGLGRCTAEYMRRDGVKIILADMNAELLEETAADLRSRGGEVGTTLVDVRDYDQCCTMVEHTLSTFGTADILVNSAGIGGSFQFFAESTPSDWQDLIDINFRGVINCCRAVTDHMSDRSYGKIISLASEAGKANEKRMVLYGATKGGVISFTRGLALEMGRYQVNVNAVCPGVTKTPMTSWVDDEVEQSAGRFYPLGRLGRPEDIAPLITFLASDESSWITGQAISVSGGFGRS
jgi:NAD(P)-dependent dehydrogenase (short-subunit alcohol dehydrogenase family)